MTYSLRDLMTSTLSMLAVLDVDDLAAADRALERLDLLLSELLEHIRLDDTVVSWTLDTDVTQIYVRESRGRISHELVGLCERAAQVEVAIAERRAYRGELAEELYFALADLCLSVSKIAPELGVRPDELRAVA